MAEDLEQEMEDLIADAMTDLDEPKEEEVIEDEEEIEVEPEEDDSDLEEEEEEPKEEPEEEEVDSFEPIEIEVSGHKVTIESKEDMMAYLQAGASTFNKEPESHVEEKSIIDQGNLSAEDLKLVVEAKNGSKEALAKLARNGDIDLLELEDSDADNYKQKQEYTQATEVDKVADSISADPVHLQEFQNVAKSLPQDFIGAVTSNAEALQNFSRHIKEGLAQEIIPKAITAQMKSGGSFMEHYSKIGQSIMNAKSKPEAKREMSAKETQMRKRAKAGGGNPKAEKIIDSGDDVWNMTDEEFSKMDLSKLK
ncbi:MAG: hypothetical protein GQ570_08600 [Helicobacteraceae bacterium]|nr:hypothetical protein [Helicobacteraceae bacterium]